MAQREPATAFEVRLDAPATPELVLKTAQLVSAMLEAAGQSSSDPGVTLEVFNYNTRVLVHPRNRQGRSAAAKVVRFVADPVGAARKHPSEAQLIAQAMSGSRRLLVDRKANFVVAPKGSNPVQTQLDEPFLDSVRGLAEGEPLKVLLSPLAETEEITQVLRVGRSSLNAEMTARIVVNGEPYDLPFEASCKAQLFALAESEKLARLRLEVVTDPQRQGSILAKLSRILEVSAFEEMSGAEFMQSMQRLAEAGPLFSRPIEDIVADLEDRW